MTIAKQDPLCSILDDFCTAESECPAKGGHIEDSQDAEPVFNGEPPHGAFVITSAAAVT